MKLRLKIFAMQIAGVLIFLLTMNVWFWGALLILVGSLGLSVFTMGIDEREEREHANEERMKQMEKRIKEMEEEKKKESENNWKSN